MGGASIQNVHYFDHGYLEEEKSMIHSFTVTFGAKYLTGMVTSVPPYKTFSLIKNNILHQSKNYKITSKIQISEVCDLCFQQNETLFLCSQRLCEQNNITTDNSATNTRSFQQTLMFHGCTITNLNITINKR